MDHLVAFFRRILLNLNIYLFSKLVLLDSIRVKFLGFRDLDLTQIVKDVDFLEFR